MKRKKMIRIKEIKIHQHLQAAVAHHQVAARMSNLEIS
jgi:hypothetical protein